MDDETKPRLCFSYLRFSRAEQSKGNSIKRQVDLREAYCARHNLVLDESRTYEDRGVSGFHGKNLVAGHFAEFLALVESGAIPEGSVLLIESIDRFSRDSIVPARNAMENLLQAGVEIHTLASERIYNRDSLRDPYALIGMILEFNQAHEYSQQLSRRLSAAWSSKREKARVNQIPLTKRPPAWLRVVNGKYEVIPERGQVVELIYQLCVEGYGVNLITKELIRRQISPFTRRGWTEAYVAKILLGEAPIGHHQPSRRDSATGRKIPVEKILNLFPPVVTEDLNARVKVAMRRRNNHGGRVNLNGKIHPFAGLLKTHNGSSLWLKHRKVGRKDPKMVPFLSDRSNGNTYPLPKFEQIMLEWLTKYEPAPVEKQANSELTVLEGKIALLENKIEDLKAAIRCGTEYKSFLSLLWDTEKEKEQADRRLDELRAIQPMQEGFTVFWAQIYLLWNIDYIESSADREAAKAQRHEALLKVRATLRRMIEQIEVTIGTEHRFWTRKSLRVTVTFRDGTKKEFTHIPEPKSTYPPREGTGTFD